MDLGAKLRSLRKLRDMTVEDLSRLSGVSRSYITNIENGRKTEVSNKVIGGLSLALGINPDYFRIRDAQLPTDCLPNLSADDIQILAKAESMPFLQLTKKAIENGVSAETVEAVIDAIIKAQQSRRASTK